MTDTGPASRIVLVSALPDLCALSRRTGVTACSPEGLPGLSVGALRLVVFGADADVDRVLSWAADVKEGNPGLRTVVLSTRRDVSRLAEQGASIDTALLYPEDIPLVEDILRAALAPSGRGSWLERLRPLARVSVTLSVFVAIWGAAVAIFGIAPYLLPSPRAVAAAFAASAGSYLEHTGVTAFEAALGFLIGNAVGFGVAVLLYRWQRLRSMTLPIFVGFQSVPIVAVAPLLVIWLGAGTVSKVAMSAIICFFPMTVNTLQGFAAVDRNAQDLFTVYRSGFLSRLRLLLVPASLASLVAALRISAGAAVVGAIVAELTGANQGLGYLLLNATYRLETEQAFVVIFLASGLGGLFYLLPGLLLLRRRQPDVA